MHEKILKFIVIAYINQGPRGDRNLLGGSAKDSLMKGLDSGVGRLREFGAPEMKTVGSCYRPWLGGKWGA